MAAPTVSSRTLPTGYRLPDGFKSTFSFASKPALQLWEIQTKPLGLDNGEPIDFKTMHNIRYRTKRPRQLLESPPLSFKFAYDPDVYATLIAFVGVEDSITDHEPDGTQVIFYGYLKSVEFDEHEEGKMPTGTATIISTFWDYVNNVEAAPVITQASGT